MIFRSTFLFTILVFVLLPASTRADETLADFYVSPSGSDDWSGTLDEPNEPKTDGPFLTLARARDAVRESGKNRTGDVTVLIRGGVYPVNETVVFGLEDSGQANSVVTYAAFPGESPVFSSGREVKNWKPLDEPVAGLPQSVIGKVKVADVSGKFHCLFDAEGILPRARSEGFIPLAGGSKNRLHFPKGRLKNWSNIGDVEIVVRPHHAWIVNILPLVSVNEEKQVATTSINATYPMNKLHFLKETESCWVENVLEELDQPGEWVLNTEQGKLYLWPRNDSTVLAPQLTELIRIEGEIDEDGPTDNPVRNLCFRGLTFSHGERYSLAEEDAGLQHDWDLLDKANALVRLRGTENCTIEQVSICRQWKWSDSGRLARATKQDLGKCYRAHGWRRHFIVRIRPGHERCKSEESCLQQPYPSRRSNLLALSRDHGLAKW